jgi:predicted metalloprotease
LVAVVASAALTLAGCASVVNGHPRIENAPNAQLAVHGDSHGHFDQTVKNALSDVMDFWKGEFPKVSGGKPLPPLKGGLWSVDGLKVAQTHNAGEAKGEACAGRDPGFVVDNGAFCTLDDSIAWDRAPTHLFAQLDQKYGDLMVAMIFAHEFGHAIQYRLGIFNQNLPTIFTESQADCAAGAWTAWAMQGNAAHFRDVTPEAVDHALVGFLDARDRTPGSTSEVASGHGNGFDRLSAVADGIEKGATYCYSDGYYDSRTFTERPYSSERDYEQGGNVSLAEVLKPGSKNFFVNDMNRFWTSAAQEINKTFTPVRIAAADHPPCDSSTEFGYCPDDNTVYYNESFAEQAYNSLPGVEFDSNTGNVRLVENQPGDFALGVLFAIGWGMAVRHQFFDRSLDGQDALTAAVCYTGAYAKDINLTDFDTQHQFILSPADLDEAASSMLNEVGKPQAFGARGTTGLDRVQDFVRGYRGGLSGC